MKHRSLDLWKMCVVCVVTVGIRVNHFNFFLNVILQNWLHCSFFRLFFLYSSYWIIWWIFVLILPLSTARNSLLKWQIDTRAQQQQQQQTGPVCGERKTRRYANVMFEQQLYTHLQKLQFVTISKPVYTHDNFNCNAAHCSNTHTHTHSTTCTHFLRCVCEQVTVRIDFITLPE